MKSTTSKILPFTTTKYHMESNKNKVNSSTSGLKPKTVSSISHQSTAYGTRAPGPVPCTCGRQFGLGGPPHIALSALDPTESAGPGLAPLCCWRH